MLDRVYGANGANYPTNWYLGYGTGTPTDTSPGTEVSGNGYSRVVIANNVTSFPATTTQIKTNGSDLAFPIASAQQGQITTVVFWDAPSGGNPWLWFPLTSSMLVATNKGLVIPASALTWSFQAGGMSNYLKNALLNHYWGGVIFSPTPTVYFTFTTTAGNDEAAGTEVTGGNYARVGITNNINSFPAILLPTVAPTTKQTSTSIDFPVLTADIGTATHVAAMDALTDGNYYGSWALPSPIALNTDVQASIAAGNLKMTLD